MSLNVRLRRRALDEAITIDPVERRRPLGQPRQT